MAHIGLVAEGSHDYFMLEPLVTKELESRGHQEVVFSRLQPIQDATGYYLGGGWTRVVAWCLDNAADSFESSFVPPLDGVSPVDAILIHLDGDAAGDIVPRTSVPSPTSFSTKNRVDFIVAAVESWLQVTPLLRKKVIVAVPVMHTEAWLNAAISHIPPPYEDGDAKTVLRAMRDPAISPTLAEHYQRCARIAKEFNQLIADRCISYELFLGEIGRSILGKVK